MVQDIFLVLTKIFNWKKFKSTFQIPFNTTKELKCPLKLIDEVIVLYQEYDHSLDLSAHHHLIRLLERGHLRGVGPYLSTVKQDPEECSQVT